jgi:ribosomal protein L7/L12
MPFDLARFLELKQAGSSQDEILTAMKEQGLNIIEAIKASRSLFGVGLGEAKLIVASHPSWSETALAARPFQDAVIESLSTPTGDEDTVITVSERPA